MQIVLRERGFYQGEPDGILNQQTTHALIAFDQPPHLIRIKSQCLIK